MGPHMYGPDGMGFLMVLGSESDSVGKKAEGSRVNSENVERGDLRHWKARKMGSGVGVKAHFHK